MAGRVDTPKEIIAATIGRDYQKPKLNPPAIEYAPVKMHNPGLFWMGLVKQGRERIL